MSVRDQSHLILQVIDCLTSLQDLQILMVLMDDPERWWASRALADDTGISQAVTRPSLDRLAARNLLDIRVTDDIRFRFRPGTPELEEAGRAFSNAYRRNPLAIIVATVDKNRIHLEER